MLPSPIAEAPAIETVVLPRADFGIPVLPFQDVFTSPSHVVSGFSRTVTGPLPSRVRGDHDSTVKSVSGLPTIL